MRQMSMFVDNCDLTYLDRQSLPAETILKIREERVKTGLKSVTVQQLQKRALKSDIR